MGMRQQQARSYLEEAELTLDAAKAVFTKAREERKVLWAIVVKNCYDAIEQAVSSAIAAKQESIPRLHPEKINRFIELYRPPQQICNLLNHWLSRRASAQYIDVRKGRLSIPHELFSEREAEKALSDTERFIAGIKERLHHTKPM